jgi:Mn-containing catalase
MKKRPGKLPSGQVAEGWRKALRNEVEGREFYRMAADNASLDGVRQMFTFLMEEEERHREAILEQIDRMADGKPPRLVRRRSGKKESGKFRSRGGRCPLDRDDARKAGHRAVHRLS